MARCCLARDDRPVISTLTLTDFRPYERARLEPGVGVTERHGPNGAGTTNGLEAVSFLTRAKPPRLSLRL